jgi:hypothetical protein
VLRSRTLAPGFSTTSTIAFGALLGLAGVTEFPAAPAAALIGVY